MKTPIARPLRWQALCVIAGVVSLVARLAAAAPNRAPNVVVVLADDMGYGDVHALNPDSAIPTPHLDALAASGMTFTDAHTPSAVCTPTRYGLVTGRYCWRGRLKRGVLNGMSPRLIEEGRQTIANLLKSAGYRTGIVGKWHLGLGWTRTDGKKADLSVPVKDTPNALGFDYSYIIPASLDFPPYVYIENDRVTDPTTVQQASQGFPAYLRSGPRSESLAMEDALDHLTAKAVAYITEQAKTAAPFFLYFPLTAPHKPVLPHRRFRGKSKLGDYGDFVAQVDWVVGQVRDALTRADVADNTLVIYTSDNGSFMFRLDDTTKPDHVDDPKVQAFRVDRHRANGPWRGTKADIWEAGHRIPFFVVWPGHVKPGSGTGKTVCLTDIMATVADITGAEIGANAAEDSFSFLPLLTGQEASWVRPPVINHSASGMFAIREGTWKLVAGNGSGGREPPKGKPFGTPYRLFDLGQDPNERNDVAAENPERVKEMTDKLEAIRSSGRSVER